MQSLSDIPPEATPLQVFRLPVEVLRVDERVTRTGDPCYFLHVRDADGQRFPIVCWDWQWAKLSGRITVGREVTLDVKVPTGDYLSFTLAGTGAC